MEALKEELVANIRACLISNKGNCTLRQLSGDYKMIIGNDIEYKKLNYGSLEEFLKSIDSLIVTKVDGQVFVEAKLNEKSKHIVEMVAKQRFSKKKRVVPARGHRNYWLPPQRRWHPKNIAEKKYIKEDARKTYTVKKEKVNNNNAGEIKDLRQVLNNKKKPEMVPYSERTNRLKIMAEEKAREDAASTVNWDLFSSCDEGVLRRKKKEPLEFTGDPIADLHSFTKYHKISEPAFKVMSRKCKYPRKTVFDCKLQIGDDLYSSYPNEFLNETAAKEFVAKNALEELVAKQGKRASLLISNDQDVLDRIPELVRKYSQGVWMSQIEKDYADLYNEGLPINWLQVIDRSPMISIERVTEKRHLLRFCRPEDIFQKGKPSVAVSDVSVPMKAPDFGEEEFIIAEVTCAVSAKEVWCRQLETREAEDFDVMIINMSEVYNELQKRNALCKPVVTEGGYYAVLIHDYWHRVCAVEVNDSTVSCFLIDYGGEHLVSKDHVFQLERKFAKHHAQAFSCRLAGLEELYEFSLNSTHLNNLIGKVVYLEVQNSPGEPYDHGVSIPVVLYHDETHETINQRLISEITIESAMPVLFENSITEVYISHVKPNGDVFINIRSPGFDKLTSLLQELEADIDRSPMNLSNMEKLTPRNTKDKVFFAKYRQDGHWYRVKIVEWSLNLQRAEICFIDYGNCDTITVSKELLYPLDQLSDVADQFPAQAVKVRMQIKTVPEDFVRRIRELAPGDKPVLLKMIGSDREGVPIVNFFKRVGSKNELCLINETIDFEEEQRSSRRTPERLQRLMSGVGKENMPSAGILSAPAVPKVGEFFDVTIPMAVNPWNFFVQPYETKGKLNELMQRLQVKYEKVRLSPLSIEDVELGGIYISKHDDGKWYRTSVMKVINPGSISVFYCDFGYYANLSVQQLAPISPEFLDLPYQAIKAKLYGIAPKQSKWLMEDCTHYQKIVCKKSFVSIIMGSERDELYRFDNVLILKLIDTSTDVDVHIDELLIRRGIAVAS